MKNLWITLFLLFPFGIFAQNLPSFHTFSASKTPTGELRIYQKSNLDDSRMSFIGVYGSDGKQIDLQYKGLSLILWMSMEFPK